MEAELNDDKQLIETTLNNYVRYWNAHEMDSWGELFTSDVDYINRNGGWWKNNEENIAGHKRIHQSLIEMGQPSTFSLEIQKIEFLKSDVAVVQVLSEWPGFKSYDSGEGSKNLKGIMSCIFLKMDENWKIKALHNTLR